MGFSTLVLEMYDTFFLSRIIDYIMLSTVNLSSTLLLNKTVCMTLGALQHKRNCINTKIVKKLEKLSYHRFLGKSHIRLYIQRRMIYFHTVYISI